MSIAPSNSNLSQPNQPKAPESHSILPDDLIPEILSLLDVKSLLKIRCVCKSWKSLISNPIFVQLHLKRYKPNPKITLYAMEFNGCAALPFPICRLLDNPLDTLPNAPCYRLMDKGDCDDIVGSCNGLICLKGSSPTDEGAAYWFYLWNPTTRQVSKQLGYFRVQIKYRSLFKFMFGYDNSTCTYKLVALHLVGNGIGTPTITDLKVLSIGDNVWRVIQSLPLVPLGTGLNVSSCNVDFKGSLNWLALHKDIGTGYIDLGISSFDLATETYLQLRLPPRFIAMPFMFAHIYVSMDCLCFSHGVEKTHLVIWKMTEFGVHESWTQFLKISYKNLDIDYNFGKFENLYRGHWIPLHIDRNRETVIFSKYNEAAVFIYNWRDNTVKRIRITEKPWWRFSHNYVESLVSPRLK